MRNIFNKRIPTLFGFLAIVLGIGLTSLLTQQGVIFTGQASPSNEPTNVQITNVSDTSFTVSYTTADSVLGSLNVGTTTGLGTTVLDERDKIATGHNVHVITVRNLNPQTPYLFSITSGEDSFLKNGALYSVRTGPALEASNLRGSMSGKVIAPDGTSPKEALIYLNIPGAQILSTLIKADGSYTISLNSLRTSDLSSYFTSLEEITAKLSVFDGSLSSQASLSTDISDVPTITLSQNYDFTTSELPISSNDPMSTSSAKELFPTSTPSGSLKNTPQIITPKKDQGFSDDQPLFRGTAQPNQDVEISIHSDEAISAKVVADANGNWTYRPDSSLSPGTHTITIKTKDSFGILKTITQQFVVYASGTQVGESATPSATLTPTPTPTLTITPIATVTPTEIDTPSPTPTPTAALAPAGTSTIPAMGAVAGAFIFVGSILFILTRLRI